MTRFFAPAALVFLAVSPAFADTVTDTVLAFDRKANLIILADKTVFDVTGAHSGVIRPPIPIASGHPYRFNPATQTGASGHP